MTDAMLDDWLKAARLAADNAYAPYSEFRVGAVVVDTEGGVHVGCNVENAAYPEGTCAEAGAIAAMVAAGKRDIAAVVVWSNDNGAEPTTPCGGCRQKIGEFASEDCVIYCDGADVERIRFSVSDLLPSAFSLKN